MLNAPFIELSKYNGAGACPRLLFPVTAGTRSVHKRALQKASFCRKPSTCSQVHQAPRNQRQVMPIRKVLVPRILQHHILCGINCPGSQTYRAGWLGFSQSLEGAHRVPQLFENTGSFHQETHTHGSLRPTSCPVGPAASPLPFPLQMGSRT